MVHVVPVKQKSLQEKLIMGRTRKERYLNLKKSHDRYCFVQQNQPRM